MPKPASFRTTTGAPPTALPTLARATCVPTAEGFLAVVKKSRLVPSAVLKRLRRELTSGGTVQPRFLADKLVADRHVTRWQAEQLLAGRSRFFLGRYKFLDRIGVGGMGAVFKAEHVLMGRIVALKMIRPKLLSDATTVRRFLKEVKAVAALEHPNIVAAFDADKVDELHFLVTEFIHGKDLNWWVAQRGPFSEKWACEFCRQAALGLQHAHERGLMHCDIKPANLLAVRDDTTKPPVVKILDFGLARLATANAASSDSALDQAVAGTFGFMAPEFIRDPGRPDKRSDIFSLGCTLFYLLTGTVPFPGNTDLEHLENLFDGKPLEVRSYVPDISPALEKLLTKLLARNPGERIQTAAEVAEVLWPFSAAAYGFASVSVTVPLPPPAADRCDSLPALQPGIDPVLKEFGDNHLTSEPTVEARSDIEQADPQPLPNRRQSNRLLRRRMVAAIVGMLILAVVFVGKIPNFGASSFATAHANFTASSYAPEPRAAELSPDTSRLHRLPSATTSTVQPGRAEAFVWIDETSDETVWHFSANELDPHGMLDLRHTSYTAETVEPALLAACQRTNQLMLEAIITPADIKQSGPARIITFSSNATSRNFTLAQQEDKLILRLRTPANGENGTNVEVELCTVAADKPHHVVVSYSPGRLCCFVNGQQTVETDKVKGDFRNWTSQHLLFGDEWNGERKWSGTLQRVTISNQSGPCSSWTRIGT